ncbi:hypothetical protein HN592_05905 [Candidatus Woesearchaeota archaeon]|jgi:lysylphosphatidylglycerol synthetase-like protein (DUF2156 family)|nr:hypothetical protein [Candidatus Woesearchaeota archaeon]MBT3304790.1 hypothetical protein [Candidatus Woesearchaeota archaeon]MBT4367874.1 hypothetical protein [Candidatus Woesearchaeota archaeon]MBT4712362.1 hypothetical protein [Candidatus Woesearchaeota archaeon]MBT6639274.1 hypothetical protein [Candidatus Woesearchaeota archaeon]
MADGGALVGAVGFLDRLGVYDVVLPFLLVFTITFALLEKSKIFGLEEINGKEYPRRNLNAMAAFVIAFLVVASTNLVGAINRAVANMVLLLILSASFLLLVGSFTKPSEMKEGIFLEKKWRNFFMAIVFIAIIFIFLDAIRVNGQSWLEIAWGFMASNWSSSFVGVIILLVIIGGFMFFLSKDKGSTDEEES